MGDVEARTPVDVDPILLVAASSAGTAFEWYDFFCRLQAAIGPGIPRARSTAG